MKMKDKDIIELLARREGYEFNPKEVERWKSPDIWVKKDGELLFISSLPNYLEDDSAILRIVRGLSEKEYQEYSIELMDIREETTGKPFCRILQATTREMAEALYIALGGET